MSIRGAVSRGGQRGRTYVVLGVALSAFAGYGLYATQIAEKVQHDTALRQGIGLAVVGALLIGGIGRLTGRMEGRLLSRGGGWTLWMRISQVMGWILATVGVLVSLAIVGVFSGLSRLFDLDAVDLAEHQVYLLATLAWALLLGYVLNATLWMLPAGLMAGAFSNGGDNEPVSYRGRGFSAILHYSVSHEASFVLAVLGVVEVTLGAALGFPQAVGLGLACLGLVLTTAAWALHD